MLCYGASIKSRLTGREMARIINIIVASAVAAAGVPTPLQAQHSDSYTFHKAVKERDGAKAASFLAQPGSTVVNTRDGSGEGALHHIVRARDLGWLGFLIGKGARVDIQNREGNTPLALAAQIGWAEGAQVLLSRGASVNLPNSRGETPLIFAVQKGDMPMVRLLLNKGADPKRTDSVAGYSAIDYARQNRRLAAILKLLEAPRSDVKQAAGPKL